MSSVSPNYTPGAVVNGHYLASDYRWYPVSQPAPVVVAPSNAGVTVGVWIIVAILTFPIWIWFVPLAAVVGIVWGAVLVERHLYRSTFRSYGWVGVSILTAVQVAAVAAIFVYR